MGLAVLSGVLLIWIPLAQIGPYQTIWTSPYDPEEMNREERLSKSSFTRLPNVKGTVAEDARITGSPLRSELASVIREKMALSGHLSF